MRLDHEPCPVGYVPKCKQGTNVCGTLTLDVAWMAGFPRLWASLIHKDDRDREGRRIDSMAAQLLKQLLGKLCPHRFSWPHSGNNGQDYQVCLICGTVYAYDWSTMRRTVRLTSAPNGQVGFMESKQP